MIHTYIPTYLHTYIPTYIHTYIHTYMHACIHTYIHIYLYIYIYLHITLPLFDGSILVNTGQYPEPDINWCLDILYQLLFKYFYPGLFFGNLWSLPSDSPMKRPQPRQGHHLFPPTPGPGPPLDLARSSSSPQERRIGWGEPCDLTYKNCDLLGFN